jgi:predicted P-loop ATPase
MLSAGRLADMLPAAALRFNEMTLRAEVHTSSGWQRITDADLDSAYVVLSGKGWKVGAEPVIKAIIHTARQAPHHPVRAYLQQVESDPSITPFDLDQVAPRFFRAKQPLHVAMVRKWLIGAVSRALNPGCQMDYVLVLQGAQGQLKSTSLGALGSPDWYCSSIPENEKDLLLNIHSTWLYELAELESVTSRKESGRLKNLITTSADLVRVPYGRTSERMARQSVFCATVNEDTFLRDDTGNRRFWVVPVEGTRPIDKTGLLAARDAIWKAAVAAYRVNELPMLPPELEALSSQQNQEFNQQDPWVEMVLAWMDGEPLHRWDPDRDPSTVIYDANRPFTSAEILYSAGLRRLDQITRADEMRVAAVLRQLRFDRAQKRVDGRIDRFWLPSQPSQPSQPQAAEVVTPQTPAAAMGLGVPSQPSQPFSTKKELKKKGHATPCAGAISQESFEKSRRGCDTLATSLAPQSFQPSQPTFHEVVTPREVVTPSTRQEDERRILELRPTAAIADWSDAEVSELRQSLEQVAKRQSSGFAIPVQEAA